MKRLLFAALVVFLFTQTALADIGVGGPRTKSKPLGAIRTQPYSPYSLSNPYGAGSPYRANGLMNPYSKYGSPYSNRSWTNPYATKAPQLYGPSGRYYGRLSTNPYAKNSTSNRYGKYGSRYSPYSLKNPYGAGSRYSTRPIYVYPSK